MVPLQPWPAGNGLSRLASPLHDPQVTRLRESGVAVLSQQQPGLMHHKFAILDSSRLLNGSFNWTGRAVFSNSENLVISADPALVTAFQGEFDRLWSRGAAGDGGK